MSAALASVGGRALCATLPPSLATDEARRVLEALRAALLAGEDEPTRETLLARASDALLARARAWASPRTGRVLNATGVVVHTNLGRAPLAAPVLRELEAACGGYAAVEYDLDAGSRGHRDALVGPALAALAGSEDALVANNCAAALLLGLSALAAGREVLVSRGELVEIGGGFRVPDVVQACGARLVEVGTTNRTRLEDYARAAGPQTAAILRVHRSNFALVGFTGAPERRALAGLAHERGLPLLEDLGSGLLERFGEATRDEPLVGDAVRDGADLVCFSGDKLLGGPQAGVVVGRRAWVEPLRRHPLARALRPGRLVLAALEGTLRAYLRGRAAEELPVARMLCASEPALRERAEALRARAATLLGGAPAAGSLELERVEGRVGGGALPLAVLPSWAVAARLADEAAVQSLLAALRRARPVPLVARGGPRRVWLDVRTLDAEGEVELAAAALASALAAAQEVGGMDARGTPAPFHLDPEDELRG